MTVEELLEIEQIRLLRNAYSACIDSGDVAGLAELFCTDAVCELPEGLGGSWVGLDAIVSGFTAQLAAARAPGEAVHVVTNPWITLTGPDTAHGTGYLLDLHGEQPHGNPLRSLGRFEDDYRKVDDHWRFADVRLPFFWSAGS